MLVKSPGEQIDNSQLDLALGQDLVLMKKGMILLNAKFCLCPAPVPKEAGTSAVIFTH